ncbi:MAG TPA: hypothetical protein VEJ16_18655 [Alphaproteobacteria bacterium]|nr:hypothetical protein [Alphaproteobacteria bacterium]
MGAEGKEKIELVRELTPNELEEVNGGGAKETVVAAGVWLSNNFFQPVGQFVRGIDIVKFWENVITGW